MAVTLVLALQAMSAPLPAPPLLDLDFDLARYSRLELGRDCRRDDPSAITVCGRRSSGGAYPLAEMARIFEPGRLVARARIVGNLTADIHVENAAMPDGTVSNRLMIGLRLPF